MLIGYRKRHLVREVYHVFPPTNGTPRPMWISTTLHDRLAIYRSINALPETVIGLFTLSIFPCGPARWLVQYGFACGRCE